MSLLLSIKTSLAPWPTPEIGVESPKVKGLNVAVLVSLVVQKEFVLCGYPK